MSRYKDLSIFFENNSVKDDSLLAIYKNFRSSKFGFMISFQTFRHMVKNMGLRYRKIAKTTLNKNTSNLNLNVFTANLLNALCNKKALVLFFDITSFSDSSFKQNAWTFINFKNNQPKQFTYNLTHLFGLISLEKNFYFKFFKGNINNFDIIHFLKGAINHLKKTHPKKKLYIILDNARLHKTKYFLNFAALNLINLIFTLPHHPMLNCIEYCFRFLKSRFKMRASLR